MEDPDETMVSSRPARAPLKNAHPYPAWKEKLLHSCLKRVQEDRVNLLWKLRLFGRQALDQKKEVEFAFRGIVADELKRIKHTSLIEHTGISKSVCDDQLWEYDSQQEDCSTDSHYEELLIEMERYLYEDLREESIRKELEAYEEEDEYLSRAVFEHMQLNDGEAEKKESLWCPICKRGEVQENVHHLLYCTSCNFQLDPANKKANLEFLRNRLGEVHEEHLDKGCRATPSFSMETAFDLTALYVTCHACNTFEIVL